MTLRYRCLPDSTPLFVFCFGQPERRRQVEVRGGLREAEEGGAEPHHDSRPELRPEEGGGRRRGSEGLPRHGRQAQVMSAVLIVQLSTLLVS